jgi:hypothetical protein
MKSLVDRGAGTTRLADAVYHEPMALAKVAVRFGDQRGDALEPFILELGHLAALGA